ncbi:MAG TPA: VWA domain-containing protein [Acidobacteriota bacterium]|nr:VWA domain-containing protein [Acidobacteriota bacterium]
MPHFANPWFLLLLAVIPLLIWKYLRRRRDGEGSLRFGSTLALEGVHPSWTVRMRPILFCARMVAFALIVTAMARPQRGTEEEEYLTEGIDIVIALDASGSMAAEDFLPRNRFYVAKLVTREFVEGLRHDRAGLVVFAAKSLTRCPLTLDYGVLLNILAGTELGTIEDGTAIGNALATCLNRLRDSKAKSRVIILVTDGVNNRGEIQPLDAAKIAHSLGIRIYTVGVGSEGTARFPVTDPSTGKKVYVDLPVEIDEASLTRMAEITGGIYYRATDAPSLEKIFQEIDRLEKTKIQVRSYTHFNERFAGYLLTALAVVLLASIAGFTRFEKVP